MYTRAKAIPTTVLLLYLLTGTASVAQQAKTRSISNVGSLLEQVRGASVSARVSLPLPDGQSAGVDLREASVMHPDLQARYPEIRSFIVEGEGISGRLAVSHHGLHALLFTPRGDVEIHPVQRGGDSHEVYYLHATGDAPSPATKSPASEELNFAPVSPQQNPPEIGGHLQTYRLAMPIDPELTREVSPDPTTPGTVSDGMALVNEAVSTLNAVYGRDVAVQFTLVANNDRLVLTDAANNLYVVDHNNAADGERMLMDHRAFIENQLGGGDTYDIGHAIGSQVTFNRGGGGRIESACESVPREKRGFIAHKAYGFSPVRPFEARPSPKYHILFHEVGHQLGAVHTWVGLQPGGPRAFGVEPDWGYTIMGYANFHTERPEAQRYGAYFHAQSILEIDNYVRNLAGNTCGASSSSTGNDVPVVRTLQASYTIPAATPFVLEGSATDGSGKALTYTWEQMDMYGDGSGAIPLFRSFDPRPTGQRIFPDPSVDYFDETLPTAAATYNFRLTARDNVGPAGGVGATDVTVTTVNTGAPFAVTFAATAGLVFEKDETITWDVSGTDAGDIGAAFVDILFSEDGGVTYPHVLVAGTVNDGSAEVTFPKNTIQGRVKVAASGDEHIFFNVSEVFEVTNALPSLALSPTSVTLELGPDETASATVSVNNNAQGAGASTLRWSASLENAMPNQGPQDACDGAETVEQGNHTTTAFAAHNTLKYGQSFVAPCTGRLMVVEPSFSNELAGTEWTMTIRVYEGAGTSGTLLASSSHAGTKDGSDGFSAFVLEQPVPVAEGQTYTFFFDLHSGLLPFRFSTANEYAGGERYSTSDGNPASALPHPGEDLTFRLTVEQPDVWWAQILMPSGSVAPGESGEIELAFDTEGLALGTYQADLVVASNDPSRPSTTLPVSLIVSSGTSTRLLSGHVRTSNGIPVEGVSIDLQQAEALLNTTSTNADGEYSFAGLSEGIYRVVAQPGDYTMIPPSFIVTVGSTDAIDVDFTARSTRTSDVLVVDGTADQEPSVLDASTPIRDALTASGIASDLWDREDRGRLLTAEDMAQYSVVIWAEGREGELDTDEQALIQTFLAGGGRLLVAGQKIGTTEGAFAESVLRVSPTQTRLDASEVQIAGAVQTDFDAFSATLNDYAQDMVELDPTGGSEEFLFYESTSGNPGEQAVAGIAYTDVDPDDGDGFKEGIDVLIAKWVDVGNDGPGAGDMVVTDKYPTVWDSPSAPVDFSDSALFGDFTVTSHTMTSGRMVGQGWLEGVDPNGFRFAFLTTPATPWEAYYEAPNATDNPLTQIQDGGADRLLTRVESPSVPSMPVDAWPGQNNPDHPHDDAFVDVDVYSPSTILGSGGAESSGAGIRYVDPSSGHRIAVISFGLEALASATDAADLIQRAHAWLMQSPPSSSKCDSVTDVPLEECRALVDFYQATDGDNWLNNGNWLQTNTVGNWFGVTVDGSTGSRDGHVTVLRVRFNGLSGTLPATLGNLTMLEMLHLPGGSISGSIPASIGSLNHLAWLGLELNELSGEIPSVFGSLSSLRWLYLSGNQLTGSIPESMGNLPVITVLHVNHNQLTGSIPGSLGALSTLESLSLRVNQLTGPIPAELGNLTALRLLHIDHNGLSGTIPEQLGNLSSLIDLDVSSNNLASPFPASLVSLVTTSSAGKSSGNASALENLAVQENLFGFRDLIELAQASSTADSLVIEYSPQSWPGVQTGGEEHPPEDGVTVAADTTRLAVVLGGTIVLGEAVDDAELYQWYHDDAEINGADTATLTLSNLQQSDSGVYRVDASSSLLPDLVIRSRPVAVTFDPVVTAIEEKDSQLPDEFTLDPAYPNPFNPQTNIRFILPGSGDVYVGVYDGLGRQATTLVKGQLAAGAHRVVFDASAMPSGVYFVVVTYNGLRRVTPVVLLK